MLCCRTQVRKLSRECSTTRMLAFALAGVYVIGTCTRCTRLSRCPVLSAELLVEDVGWMSAPSGHASFTPPSQIACAAAIEGLRAWEPGAIHAIRAAVAAQVPADDAGRCVLPVAILVSLPRLSARLVCSGWRGSRMPPPELRDTWTGLGSAWSGDGLAGVAALYISCIS